MLLLLTAVSALDRFGMRRRHRLMRDDTGHFQQTMSEFRQTARLDADVVTALSQAGANKGNRRGTH